MVRYFDKFQRMFLTVIGSIMVILLTTDGLGRYLLGSAISWAEETTRILFVWGCFLSITLAFISKAHIGFDSIAKKNKYTKLISGIINSLCLIVIGSVVMYYGVIFTKQVGKFPLPATQLPIIVLYLPGIIAGVSWIAIGLYQGFRIVKNFFSKGE